MTRPASFYRLESAAARVTDRRELVAEEEAERDRLIREMYATGAVSLRALAASAGVSHARVAQIIHQEERA